MRKEVSEVTRRHFVAIAKALGVLYRDERNDVETLDRVVARLLPVFRWANSRFDANQFVEAVRNEARVTVSD